MRLGGGGDADSGNKRSRVKHGEKRERSGKHTCGLKQEKNIYGTVPRVPQQGGDTVRKGRGGGNAMID